MYEFYLNGVKLPVAPSKMETKIKNQNQTVTMVDEGEINILKQPGLTEISLTCLFPNQPYPFAKYPGNQFRPGRYYLGLLEQLKVQCVSFPFKVIRTSSGGAFEALNSNMQVSLEDYTITEEAANSSDYEVKIKLCQYKEYGTKTVTFRDEEKTETTVAETREADRKVPQTYTIVSGDTLWGIAKRYLGDGNKQEQIYQLNRDVIEKAAKQHGRASSSKGNLIYSGTVLQLPQ